MAGRLYDVKGVISNRTEHNKRCNKHCRLGATYKHLCDVGNSDCQIGVSADKRSN
jgi:hypothetical protein